MQPTMEAMDQETSLIPAVRDPVPRRDPWAEADEANELEVKTHRAYRWPGFAWLIPGLLMAVVGAIRVNEPGLWADEFATWGMTTVPYSEALWVLRYVDAVLGPYYAVVHVWSDVFGNSDASIRIPSIIAMSLAAALTGATGYRVYGLRVGILAGVLLAVLPGPSRYAQEARPYAFTVCAAALATYVLVRILQGGRWKWFLAYAGAVSLLGLFHIVGLVLLAGHVWIILARRRRAFPGWCGAVLLGMLPVAPLLWYGYQQKLQVSWIGANAVAPKVYLETGFGTLTIVAILAVLALFSLPLRYPSSIFTAWATLPLLALLIASPFMSLLLPRYVLFMLPAFALLAATALSRPHLGFAIVVIGVVVALAVPVHLKMRTSNGHDDETRAIAAIIAAGYRPGDGIVYSADDQYVGSGWLPRDTVAHYVPAAKRPRDVFQVEPQRHKGLLLSKECTDYADCLGEPPPRLWVLRVGYLNDAVQGLGKDKEELVRTRYTEEQTWRRHGLTLALVVTRAGV
jgi:mannosyltransferase